ncbi:MAG: hypothetical protein GKS01_04555 [Alphaproteobacteria bacterium]|nr:hypothetical protein [Alphaproteobacteria bacterium]
MIQSDSGSYRDPRGRIFYGNSSVFRTVTPTAVDDYEFIRDSGLLRELKKEDLVIAAREVVPTVIGAAREGAAYVLEHSSIPFISHSNEETPAKSASIKAFTSEVRPNQCSELGCDTGEFSKGTLLDVG